MADTELAKYEETMLATISPLKAQSLELQDTVFCLPPLANDGDLREANTVKKDINAHTKRVKDLRLDLTRPIDQLTKALIAKEREILEPVEQAKKQLGDKILAYEEELERIRREEEKRIQTIADEILGHYKPGMTRHQVEQARERGKRYIAEMPKSDAEIPGVKLALMTLSNKLTERMNDIEIEEQRAAKKKLSDEEAKIAEERRQLRASEDRARIEREKLEAEKEATRVERNRPKSNIVEGVDFEIVDPDLVPHILCSPDEKKIRSYLKSRPGLLGESGEVVMDGIRIFKTKKVR